jgi:hypothetical protein
MADRHRPASRPCISNRSSTDASRYSEDREGLYYHHKKRRLPSDQVVDAFAYNPSIENPFQDAIAAPPRTILVMAAYLAIATVSLTVESTELLVSHVL